MSESGVRLSDSIENISGAALDALPGAQPPNDFLQVASRFGIDPANVREYLHPSEQLIGFGTGGSESLVMFVTHPKLGSLVRKVCAEELSSVPWDPAGTGVMAPPSLKGSLQVDYLNGLPEAVRPYFPAVHNVKVMSRPLEGGGESRRLVYDQSMVPGVEVSTFVADAQPTPSVVAHLHREIMRCLAERIHTERVTPNTENTIEPSYLDKIVARLELSRQAAPETFGPLLDSEAIMINGHSYKNIKELLAFFRQPEVLDMLEPQEHSLVMGDSNTENVMVTNPEVLLEAMGSGRQPDFTYDDIGIRFIDPRSIGHNSVGAATKDDRMYDNKPPHNTVGNYDVVHGEHFDIAVARPTGNVPRVTMKAHDNNPYSAPYEDIEQHFGYVMDGWDVNSEEFLAKDPNWLLRFTFMMGTHFAAMPPFHFTRDGEGNVPESVEAQKRAIAIYCEGIKWLNRARDMIVGERDGLYGVKLPPIKASNR